MSRKLGREDQVLKGLDLVGKKEGKKIFQSGNHWNKCLAVGNRVTSGEG